MVKINRDHQVFICNDECFKSAKTLLEMEMEKIIIRLIIALGRWKEKCENLGLDLWNFPHFFSILNTSLTYMYFFVSRGIDLKWISVEFELEHD